MTLTTLPPLRREILVDADPALAFEVFTTQIGRWWPLAEFSVHGADADVRFDDAGIGSRIVESLAGADDAVWGTVIAWEQDRAVSFTWHPGRDAQTASQVSVTFEGADGKTLVRLEHSGWEIFGEYDAQAREEYDHGWPVVLDGYAARVGAA
jgi:uncharacterized protein YndB with AHSA1/START domain